MTRSFVGSLDRSSGVGLAVQIREGYTTRRIPMYSGNVRFAKWPANRLAARDTASA